MEDTDREEARSRLQVATSSSKQTISVAQSTSNSVNSYLDVSSFHYDAEQKDSKIAELSQADSKKKTDR